MMHMTKRMDNKEISTPNFDLLRKQFPLLTHKTYLNSGSYCALANEVRAAIDAYMEDRLLLGANWDVWVAKNESVRALVAQLTTRGRGADRDYGLGVRRSQFPGERAGLQRGARAAEIGQMVEF